MEVKKVLAKDEEDGTGSKLISYLELICGQGEFINTIQLDHNYSKPWNWRPDNSYAKPMKSLFINKVHPQNQFISNDEILDPVSNCVVPKPAYNEEKARKLMNESWKQIRLLRSDVGDPDWEYTVNRDDWNYQQGKIFDRGCKILNHDRLARLSYEGNWNEPVLRRLTIDKSAKRLRTLFSIFGWQYQLVRWLHYLWLDILHHDYLVAYIEMLQTLKKKVPTLIERLTLGVSQSTKANPDILFMMLQSPWDPVSLALPCHVPRRLPGNPLLLIVPCGISNSNLANTRIHRWYSHLSAIGMVTIVNTNKLNTSKVTVTNSLEHLMSSIRAKISEIKSNYVGRNIILIGLNSGSALACQVSLIEPVSAVVCLGFPLNTVEEKRGQPDDSILNLTTPTLFVIGQHAATSNINDMEDLRERLHVQTSLVVVGAADDCLRITQSKRNADGMTQTMVDRCIVDEVADFIATVLLTPTNKQDIRNISSKPKVKLVERKRKISGNDDLTPKKQRVSLPSTQNSITLSLNSSNRPKKNSSARNVGRTPKWTNESEGRIQQITRKLPGEDKTLISRPSIDSIKIINKSISFKPNSTSGESTESDSYKILSEIKVLGGEVCNNENSFIGQLTADRLLEMPVIIAQEDSSSGASLTGSCNNSSHQQLQPLKLMVTSNPPTIRDDVNSRDASNRGRQPNIRCVPTAAKTSTIRIGRTPGKTLHTTTIMTKPDDNLRNTVTKCATIYFRDQGNSSQAQVHKLDIIPHTNNQTTETTIGNIRRRNFTTQLLSRPRPPRIKNFPAVKHSSTDLSSSSAPE